VKPCLVKLTLISSCALIALPAFAQSSAQPRSAAKTTAAKTPANAPKTLTAAANAANPASVTTVTAAGSVIVLSDGIVANATMAQIQPPAPGFVYER
jgi:predicted lipid-binding transport protein (Tim44 family)